MLPDVLAHNLNVVFCGTGVGKKSDSLKLYYAGQGYKFWRTLSEVGLTSRQLGSFDYEEVLEYGIDLTDLVKHKAGSERN